MKELGIVLFTSTKGHFGRKDIYKVTVNNILNQLSTKYDLRLFAHIKVSDGEEEVLEEMSSWLNGQGFTVDYTTGKWSHGTPTHASEYTRDIIKTFSNPNVLRSEFSLWLEDDWILKGYPNLFCRLGLRALKEDPSILAVRSNFGLELKENTFFPHKEILGIFHQGDNYTQYGPTFTFQPTLVRTRDVYHAYRIVKRDWDKLKNIHIELTSGYAMRALSDNPNPFCFISPKICNSIHIGAEPFEKILEK